MVETKIWTKQEYVDLMPPFSKSDFERLKKFIRVWVTLDAYHSKPG